MFVLLRPSAWAAHALMLLACAAAVLMGVWQWHVWSGDRADARRTLVNARPVALSTLMSADGAFPGNSIGQPVTFAGTWLTSHTLYVRDTPLNGRNGFAVVTPVVIGHSAVPVVRGWSRTASAPAVSGKVSVTGWLEPSQDNYGEPDTNPNDDVITSLRIPSMTQYIPVDLYDAYVVGSKVSSGTTGLAAMGPTQQPDVSGFTGLRNILYAFQWWIFAIFAVFIWGRWCYDQLHPPADHPAEEAVAADPVPSGT